MIIGPAAQVEWPRAPGSASTRYPGMADDLVNHRVKECCVRLHSCVQKWKQLNSRGLELANKLVQTVMQTKYTEVESSCGVLQDASGLAASLEGKLIMEREALYSQLVQVREEMSAVVQEMGGLSGSVATAVELLFCQGHDPEKPLFDTLPPSVYRSYFSEVFEAYSQDMCVKENVVGDITRQNDRDILTVYLLCWLHQPYITMQCCDKLEALLIDSGLRT